MEKEITACVLRNRRLYEGVRLSGLQIRRPLPVAISVNLCKAVQKVSDCGNTAHKLRKPEERLISLEISLLHFKIDARSAALRVDS